MKAKLVPAARGLLRWSQNDLAEKAGLTRNTVNNLENEEGVASESLLAVETAFHRQGVIFLEDGVRKLDLYTETLEGGNRHLRLFDDIFLAGDECLINGADESKTPPALVSKVRDLRGKGLRMRHIVKHGDTFLRGDVKEYRWMLEEFYTNQPSFIYGGTLALDTPGKILLLRNPEIAEGQRLQFNFHWSVLEQPAESTCGDRYV